jgi:hypothetical protein
MFNNVEKFLNMFIFSINCLIARNDVSLRELRLKQVGIIKPHTLYNPIIKRPTYFLIGRMLKSSYSFEAALTLDWDYDGFPVNLKVRVNSLCKGRKFERNRKRNYMFPKSIGVLKIF